MTECEAAERNCPSCSRLAAKMKDRETIGHLVHESWMKTKREQGFHYPTEFHDTYDCTYPWEQLGLPCDKCHADLVPWEALRKAQKDINRHAFDALIRWMEE